MNPPEVKPCETRYIPSINITGMGGDLCLTHDRLAVFCQAESLRADLLIEKKRYEDQGVTQSNIIADLRGQIEMLTGKLLSAEAGGIWHKTVYKGRAEHWQARAHELEAELAAVNEEREMHNCLDVAKGERRADYPKLRADLQKAEERRAAQAALIVRALEQTNKADAWKNHKDDAERASVYNDALKLVRAILTTPEPIPEPTR